MQLETCLRVVTDAPIPRPAAFTFSDFGLLSSFVIRPAWPRAEARSAARTIPPPFGTLFLGSQVPRRDAPPQEQSAAPAHTANARRPGDSTRLRACPLLPPRATLPPGLAPA